MTENRFEVETAPQVVDAGESAVPPEGPDPDDPARAFGLRRALALMGDADRPVTVLAFLVVAVLSGFLEAVVILVVVGVAATLPAATDVVALSMGPLELSVTTGEGVLLGFVLAALLAASAVPNAWLAARMGARVLARTRTGLFRGLVSASWEQQAAVSDSRFQDLAVIHAFRVANLVLVLTTFVTNVVGLLALIVAALLIDALTAGVLLLIVTVLGLVFRPLIRSVRRRSRSYVDEHHRYVDQLANVFGVLPEIRVFGVSRAAGDELERVNERTGREFRHLMFRNRLLPALYLGATAGLLLTGLAIASSQDGLDPARAGAIVVFLLRALRYSQQVQGGWQLVVEQLPYVDQVEEALDQWRPADGDFGNRMLDRAGTLQFCGAGYVYPNGEVGIEDLTVVIQPGEIVGLEGPSGSGKSTIAQLILGLRRPTSGRYLVDGEPVEQFDEVSWFSRFAYVAQDPRLIQGDVRDNVRFFRPDIPDGAIDRALDEAGLGRQIVSWSAGAARQVGLGGRELSGGERQRIAIARALAGDPDVLVMDEPTSALDRESEEIVRSALLALKGRITVILIAHRESTLTVCDRILKVDQHHVREVTTGARPRPMVP